MRLIILIFLVIPLIKSFPFNKADETYRLDYTTKPIHYDIKITPYFIADNEFGKPQYTFDGIVSINIETSVPNTNQLRVHVLNLVVSEISIIQAGDEEISREILISSNYDSETELLTIDLDYELLENVEYILTLEYSGQLESNAPGFNRGSFILDGKEEMVYGSTQAQPTFAREIFPCFDEPAFKATFQLTITKPKEYFVYSNTGQLSVMPVEGFDTYDRVIFKQTPYMSSYLVAFVIGPFTVRYNDVNSNKRFGVIVRDSMVGITSYALKSGQEIMHALGVYLDYDYYDMVTEGDTDRKFDIVALPEYTGSAMENWGLVIGREDMLLYNERFTSLYNQQKIFQVLAHEIAHQWFGNLVTCNWWGDIWLNEGFATFFQYYVGYELEPTWELEKQFLVEIVQLALLADSDINSKPLTRLVETAVESLASFDKISYNKGAAFLRMVQHLIGETEFQNALRRYLDLYDYSTTTPNDLFNELAKSETEINPEYIALFETWTTQSNYPLVSVNYNSATKEALIRQKVFQLDALNTTPDQLWYIPLTFTTADGAFLDSEVKAIMKTESITLPIDTKGSWLIFNVKQVGFYRVNYDIENWEHIRQALFSKNHGGIPEENRAQIVDDLFNLARANEISYAFAFSILDYLKTETNYLPWHSAFTSFSLLLSKMNENQREDFKGYILKLLDESFKAVGFLRLLEEARFRVYHRANVLKWLGKFGHENLNLQIQSQYDIYKSDQSLEIHINIRSLVLCHGARKGDIYDVVYLWNLYLKEEDPSQQQMILGAIGCAKKKDAIHAALDYILTPSVRDQDRQRIFSLTYTQTEENVQHVLDYYITNHNKVIDGFKGKLSTIISVLDELSGKFTNQDQIDQMATFYQDNKNTYQDFETIINDALANARKNLEWNQENIPNIVQLMIKVDYRLDEPIIPIHYDLEIIPYVDANNEFDREQFTFDGIVKIHIKVSTPGRTTLRLNLKELDLKIMTIVEEESSLSDILVISNMYDDNTEIETLVFDKELKNDQIYILTIEYSGYIRDDMKGFYRSWYMENGEIKGMFSTKFQATMARLVFPCFDEPNYKATFSLSIVKPVEYSVYSNTKSKATNFYSDTYDKVEFKETPIMSTYLLSFSIGKFLARPEIEQTSIGVIGRPNQYNQSSYASMKAWSALETMGRYLSYDYFDMVTIDGKLEQIQIVAIPDYISDATEHWGLISFRESNLLYDEEFTSLKVKQRIMLTIAQQISHLWFGNLVTCDWWDYAWLNEGFGVFFQYHLATLVEPTWELDKQFVIDIVQTGLLHDSEPTVHPLNSKVHSLNGKVNSPLEAAEIFDLITSNKGGSILRMIQHLIGNTKFVTALRSYIKTYDYQTVTPTNLLSAFHEIAKDEYPNLYDIIEPWTTQSNYPVIYVDYDPTRKQVTVSQKLFLLDPLETDSEKLWPIPLTWTTRGQGFTNTKPKHVLYRTSTNFAIDAIDSWVIFNVQQTGYYRVNYDLSNWATIKKALLLPNHDGIHEVNRAQIIDDLFNLARADELSWELAFSMFDYLKTETNYLPWASAFRGLDFLDNKIGNDNDFQEYLRHLLNETYLSTGWLESSSDSQLTKYHRSNILKWLCKIDDKDWISQSRNLFLGYKNENQAIPVNIREAVYCCAMRHGDQTDFDFLWEKYEAQTVLTEQNAILDGLTCAGEGLSINSVLDKIFSPSVRDQDKFPAIIRAFTETPSNLDQVLLYLIKNFDQVQTSLKQDVKTISSIFIALTLKFVTSKQTSTMEDFLLEFHVSFGEYFYTMLEIMELPSHNMQWSSTNVPKIIKQIQENLNSVDEEEEGEDGGEGEGEDEGDGEENGGEGNEENENDDGGTSTSRKINTVLVLGLTFYVFLINFN